MILALIILAVIVGCVFVFCAVRNHYAQRDEKEAAAYRDYASLREPTNRPLGPRHGGDPS